MTHGFRTLTAALVVAFLFVASRGSAAEVMCDPSFQDCRALLLTRIQNEQIGIDLSMLFMEDDLLADAIIARHRAGVRVRALVEPRRNPTTPYNAVILDKLKAAGIPMRAKNGGGMLHWKFMTFEAQNVVQFSAANYSDYYFVPIVPYRNYTDEGIFFTDDPLLVDSFRRKFDDAWVDMSAFVHYGNLSGTPTRVHALNAIDPALSFVPVEDFATRAVPHYDAEQQQIDSVMYKITEPRHADGLIRAAQRGVTVRLITEPERYRSTSNLWQAYHIDRLYMAGVRIRDRAHEGFLHQKSTLLYGQGLTIFGSSNWTIESNSSQYEHNYFTSKAWFFAWFRDNFERKWTNRTGNVETVPFAPLPPAPPINVGPSAGATGVAVSGASLRWNPGLWGHRADVYFGTTSTPPLVATNIVVTPTSTATYALPALTAGTTYYWRIVNKTVALQEAPGPVWSFATAGATTPPPNTAPSTSITGPANGAGFTAPAAVAISASASDPDGTVARVDFYAGATLLGSDAAAPYTLTWNNVAAGSYTLTVRAFDDDGAVTASAGVAINVSPAAPPPSGSVPPPWQTQDVGVVGVAGAAAASGGTFTIRGAGADVWGSADAFRYVWQRVTGDVDIAARVPSVEYVHAWVKAGVMIRERMTADSPHAFMLVSPGKGLAFQRRVTNAGLSTSTGAAGVAPAWVKLSRRGNVVTAYRSDDGTAWTMVGSDTFTMPADVHIGLAVSSHDASRSAAATFDNITITPVTTNPPPPTGREIVLYASAATTIAGNWQIVADPTAAGGQRAWNPDLGSAKVVAAAAAPSDYIELTFTAEAGRPYRLWIRGKAERDDWSNDSVHVQFSGSVDAQGAPVFRIGTTTFTEYNLESCKGCGVAGWGWEDNGWGAGVLGPAISFATTGSQTIRIQRREDGISIDQIVLSSGTYLTAPPGPAKNDSTILPRR